MSMTGARRAGWLTSMIERARGAGLDNQDIAAALEESIVFRPMTIARDDRNRLLGVATDDDVTLDDLFDSIDRDQRTR